MGVTILWKHRLLQTDPQSHPKWAQECYSGVKNHTKGVKIVKTTITIDTESFTMKAKIAKRIPRVAFLQDVSSLYTCMHIHIHMHIYIYHTLHELTEGTKDAENDNLLST